MTTTEEQTTSINKVVVTPISKKSITEDVNNGLKMDQLATKYGVKLNAMKACLKEAGLKIKKTAVKRYLLVDDVDTQVNELN